MNTSTFDEIIKQIEEIASRFSKIEGKPWKVEGSMIELQKQCGDLAKLVMTEEKYYFPNRGSLDSQYHSSKEKIADELWDVIFCAVRIAKHYDINLLKTHQQVYLETDTFLKSKGV